MKSAILALFIAIMLALLVSFSAYADNETVTNETINVTPETEDDFLYADVDEVSEDEVESQDFGIFVEPEVDEEKIELGTQSSNTEDIALTISAPDEIQPGVINTITVYVWNFGNLTAKNVIIDLDMPSDLELLDDDTVTIEEIDPYSVEVLKFDFETKKYGFYQVEVEFEDLTLEETIEVRPPHSPLLSVDISTPPIWPVGITWNIYVDVYNGGNETAQNTVVELNLSDDLSTTDPLIKSAGDLDIELPGSHVQLVWPVKVEYAGTPSVTAFASCDNCISDNETQESNTSINVVLDYVDLVVPTNLTVGNLYQATAIVENTGTDNATDVNVTITAPTQVLVQSPTSQFVNISAGEQKNIIFDLNATSSGDSLSLNVRVRDDNPVFDEIKQVQFDTTAIDNIIPVFTNIIVNPDPVGLGTFLITFLASEALSADPTVTINGNATVLENVTGNQFSYNYTITNSDSEGIASIVISGNDVAGNFGNATSSVTIDYTNASISAHVSDRSIDLPGSNFTITTADTNADSTLNGTISIVRLADSTTIVDQAPLTNDQDGNYSYNWTTEGYPAGEYNITSSLTDSVSQDSATITIVLNNPPAINTTLQRINFTSNTIYQLDLGPLFSEINPLDSLSYNYTTTDNNITVNIVGSQANISNLANFIGTSNITIFATDGYEFANQTTDVNVTLGSDLLIDSIVVSPSEPKETDVTNISVFVNNSGPPTAANTNVTLLIDGVYYNSTLVTLPINSTTQVNFTKSDWLQDMGEHNITAIVDADEMKPEVNESNNNLTQTIQVQQWHTYYGQSQERLVLSNSNDQNITFWNVTNNGLVYAYSPAASISWASLRALTRNTSNDVQANDTAIADLNLSLSGVDSISQLYSSALTDSFTVYGTTINNVPIANSSNNTNFRTGILWDSSDDSGDSKYSGEEDLVFVSKINLNQDGKFGNYDYEIRVPANLRVGGNITMEVEIR